MLKRPISRTVLATMAIAGIVSTFGTAASAQESTTKKVSRPHIDLAFCIDTTGSMSGEINNVKAKTKEIVAKLAGGKPAPIVRVGLVAYKDRGDAYVTKVFQFNDDIDKVVKDISSLEASGGGDTPESVNEAMHASVHDLHWDNDKQTLKMLFLIGDAGPHVYANDYDWNAEAKTAISRGIQINTVGCQGIERSGNGVEVFNKIAKLTDGKYESLSYRTEIATKDGERKTIISSGGKLYEVRAKDKEAWRAGADALAKSSMASEMASAPASPVARPVASRRAMMDSSAFASGIAGGGGGASAGVSRDDSNLSDLVLSTTRAAAKKRLGVEF